MLTRAGRSMRVESSPIAAPGGTRIGPAPRSFQQQ